MASVTKYFWILCIAKWERLERKTSIFVIERNSVQDCLNFAQLIRMYTKEENQEFTISAIAWVESSFWIKLLVVCGNLKFNDFYDENWKRLNRLAKCFELKSKLRISFNCSKSQACKDKLRYLLRTGN